MKWLINQLFDWLIGLDDDLVDWLIILLIDWLIDWLIVKVEMYGLPCDIVRREKKFKTRTSLNGLNPTFRKSSV